MCNTFPESVTPNYLLSRSFSPRTFGSILQKALHRHHTLNEVIRTEMRCLTDMCERLCAERNDPLFTLSLAGLMHEFENASATQVDRQQRLVATAFADMLHLPASVALRQ